MEKKLRISKNNNGNNSKLYQSSAVPSGSGVLNLSSSPIATTQRVGYSKHSQNTTNTFTIPNTTSNKMVTAKYTTATGTGHQMITRHQQQQIHQNQELLTSHNYQQHSPQHQHKHQHQNQHHYHKQQSNNSQHRHTAIKKQRYSLIKPANNTLENDDNNGSNIVNSPKTPKVYRQKQSQQVQSHQTPVTKILYKNVQMMVNKAGSLLSSVHNHNISPLPATINSSPVSNNNTNINRHLSVIKEINDQNEAMEQLIAAHAKAVSARTKNEEAICDLKQRIPEIQNIFDIHNRIGNGTFSTVLLGTLIKERDLPDNKKRKFAIKHHVPTSHPDRIMKELQCMAKIGGSNNVVGINCCIRYNESVAFIMPYLAHDRFHDFFYKMDVFEVQYYLKNLLIALRHVHKFNVIHRDVKPSNFLYNRQKRQFLLVDFGLAQQVPQCLINKLNAIYRKDNNNTGNTKDLLTDNQENNINAVLENLRLKDGKRLRESDEHNNGNTGMDCTAAKRFCYGENDNNLTTNENVLSTNQHKKGNETNEGTNNANKTKLDNQPVEKKRQTGGADAVSKCNCYGNPQVCNICLVKKEIHASRAGTPGYRPPEVLLKYPDQTTAVDIWAVGVILLSILSSVYPFFKAPNDYVALAEMVTIFGDKIIRKTAFLLDRLLTLSQRTKPLNLRKLCVRFRNRSKYSSTELLKIYQKPDGSCEVCKNCDQFYFNCLCLDSKYSNELYDQDEDIFPDSAYDLLMKLLEINPHKRITADEALQHPFFMEFINNNNKNINKDGGKDNEESSKLELITTNLATTSEKLNKADKSVIEISSDTSKCILKKPNINKAVGNYNKRK